MAIWDRFRLNTEISKPRISYKSKQLNLLININYIFMWKLFCFNELKKNLSSSIHPGKVSFTSLQQKRRRRRYSATLSSNWRMCRHFDGDFELNSFDRNIYILYYSRKMETSDGISQVKEIFRFLKYCSRQIYAKDRMLVCVYTWNTWRDIWHMKDENLYFSINCADKILLFRLFRNLWFFMTHLKWKM